MFTFQLKINRGFHLNTNITAKIEQLSQIKGPIKVLVLIEQRRRWKTFKERCQGEINTRVWTRGVGNSWKGWLVAGNGDGSHCTLSRVRKNWSYSNFNSQNATDGVERIRWHFLDNNRTARGSWKEEIWRRCWGLGNMPWQNADV